MSACTSAIARRRAALAVSTVLFGAAWMATVAATAESRPSRSELQTRDLTFSTAEGYEFDARIVLPPARERNGYGVLLMGGGIGNDLNWTAPGSLEYGGEVHQMTISGEAHADAPRLANAFARRGFTVMHWSTIRRDDPKRDAWPYEATIYTMSDQVEHAMAALGAFRAQGLFDADHVILVAHSLGCVRAVNIAADDRGIAGLVLMSAAQLTRTSPDDEGHNMNRAAASEALSAADTDENGLVDAAEFRSWAEREAGPDQPLAAEGFQELDFDRSGSLSTWELAAGIARSRRSTMNRATLSPTDGSGLLWSEDVLRDHNLPTLIVYGSFDNAQAHHAPIMAGIIAAEHLTSITIELLPGLGHQLGPESEGRIGPIDDRALSLMGDWLQRLAERDRTAPDPP